MTMRATKGEKCFYICNNIFLVLLTLCIIYPVIYVLSASFSSSNAVVTGQVVLLPKEVSLSAYRYVLSDRWIWISYANSFFYTIVGTAVALAVTVCGAYPLSKEKLPGKGVITRLVVFSMWFSAGMIPMYLNFRDLGLLNTRASIIIGFACDTFNFILLRNFFQAVPKSLEEAAVVDGANQFQILCKIYIPLSLSALATVGLFYAVAKWNGYLWSMILIQSDELLPLQVVVKKMIVDLQATLNDQTDGAANKLSDETVIYACIVISALPMMVLYPFIQRFFVKGVMVGAVKG